MSDSCTINLVIDGSRSINDTSKVIRMMPQLGASLTIVILMNLELSFMLPESSFTRFTFQVSLMTIVIYNHHIFIIQATGVQKNSAY